MNAKKCKQLRKMLKPIGLGVAYREQQTLFKKFMHREMNDDGEFEDKEMLWAYKGMRVMEPSCGRAIYQRMKKGMKHA